jgi:glucan phosphoethanolaminetransferase (alkaline phosphatase superfamily)
MDVMVDSLIQRLENRCAILFYLSDHGEALGEDGVYLHAAENEALHHPACIVWYSDAYARLYPKKIEALKANKSKRYRTDFLYHSILSSVGIETEGDCPEMNIFR